MFIISQTAKTIIRNILVLCIIEAVAGYFILSKSGYASAHVLGVLLGSFTSVVKIIQLERSINKTLDKGEKGIAYFRLQYFVRLALTAVALFIGGIFNPNINILSVGLGLINMSIASHMYRFFHKTGQGNAKL